MADECVRVMPSVGQVYTTKQWPGERLYCDLIDVVNQVAHMRLLNDFYWPIDTNNTVVTWEEIQ